METATKIRIILNDFTIMAAAALFGVALAFILSDYNVEQGEQQMEASNDNPHDRVQHNIKHHKPDEDGLKRISLMRTTVEAASHAVLDNVPVGREQALSLTKLEEALFWANAGIARNCIEIEKDD